MRERLRAALERVATLEEQLVDAHRQVRGTWTPTGLGMLSITLGVPVVFAFVRFDVKLLF